MNMTNIWLIIAAVLGFEFLVHFIDLGDGWDRSTRAWLCIADEQLRGSTTSVLDVGVAPAKLGLLCDGRCENH